MDAEDRAGTEGDGAMPARRGWRGTLAGTFRRLQRNRVDIVAASAAFWAFIALFPAMAAVVAMSGWVIDPATMQHEIEALTEPLPEAAETFLNDTAAEVAARTGTAGLGALIGIGFAVWTASAATRTLMEGLNTAHGEEERRGFFKFHVVALLLTFGLFLGFVISVAAIVVVPATLAIRPGLGWAGSLVDWVRWPMMAVFAMGGLATFYRFGPSRHNARWRWVSIGAVAATAMWILVSLGFSLYVSEFAAYNRLYGTLGGVAVLMIWFWLSAWIVLAGAELNSEIEARHRRDMSAWQSRIGSRIATLRDRV